VKSLATAAWGPVARPIPPVTTPTMWAVALTRSRGYSFDMTLFFLEYDPATGERVRFKAYRESDRAKAQVERLRLEKENARLRRDREVVLLEAVSEEALWTTHARYFKTLRELAETAGTA